MKIWNKIFILALTLTLTSYLFTPCSLKAQERPLTVAESSQFTETSRYADVMEFVKKLQDNSSLIRVEKLCVTTEGRDVPLLVIGNPPPSSSFDLKHDKRAVVYFQANIHAGEVEGKEASLMLARDIVFNDEHNLLKNLVILIAPIFNADGNEKISPENRRNQVGPEKGVGVRYNGQNLDLNRDSMKMESPEVQGLVRNVLMRWDPLFVLDSHTHNGSYHEEPVTYVWGLNPNGDTSLISYMRDKMMPAVSKILREEYNTLSVPHGDFIDAKNPEKGWRPLGPQPRYISNYIGLRNRLSILNENYPYKDFKERVKGCYYFFLSILDYCSAHREEIQELISLTDKRTIQRGMKPSDEDSFILEYDLEPMERKITVLGYEMEVLEREGSRPHITKTDKKRTYHLPYLCNYVSKRSIRFPYAYLIPLPVPEIAEKLFQHGITVERLTKSVKLQVETFKIKEIKSMERIYQGHRMNTVKGEHVVETREFPEGTLFISTAQILANVAAYLLEPESDDGLLVWNFFDRYIVPQWGTRFQTYPVYRLLYPAHVAKEVIR